MLFVGLGQMVAWLALINGVLLWVFSAIFMFQDYPEGFHGFYPGLTIGKASSLGTQSIGYAIAFGIAAHIGEMLTQIAENTRPDDEA